MRTEYFFISTSVLSTRYSALSFDDPIHPCQHVRWNCEADLSGCFQGESQSEFCRLLYGDSGWLGNLRGLMNSCDNGHRPSDWRSFRSMACMSGFGIVPTFRSIIVCLIVRKIPVTRDGKRSPALFQPASK